MAEAVGEGINASVGGCSRGIRLFVFKVFFIAAEGCVNDAAGNRPHCLEYGRDIGPCNKTIVIRIVPVEYHYTSTTLKAGD